MSTAKPRVGEPLDTLDLPRVGGGTVTLGGESERWTMLFVYRGTHCPRCKRFLNKLNAVLDDWTETLDVVVTSADPEDRARADQTEHGWNFTLCHSLTEDQMHSLGVYVSDPLSPEETDHRFAEPGAFGIRPDGSLMLVDISNGPAARPDLEELLDGMQFNITNDRPVRGTV